MKTQFSANLSPSRRYMSMTRMSPGPYQVQAIIAGHHANARTAADTDWAAIAELYAQLGRMAPNPVVELNRAVAIAMARSRRALEAVASRARRDGFRSTERGFDRSRASILGPGVPWAAGETFRCG